MAGPVVDRTDSPADARLSAPPSQWVVLFAVAFGLLFGALTCAAGMTGGVAHGATHLSVAETDELSAHAGHLARVVEPTSQSTPPADHGALGEHMACVVSVDLHAPEASSVSISDSYEHPLLGMSTECPADVDPPVPRFS